MTDTDNILVAIAAILFAIALIALIVWAFKTFFGEQAAERRLRAAARQAARRGRDGYGRCPPQALLIRRDDVEHLIMIGGPVDMLIETGIKGRPHLEPPLEDVIIARSEPRPRRP